ncbi:hypothetical protein VTN77DRAFT_7242 [Rasamsonia byssochlamydoides]|uniref:uncharacterized protein n=1 Tax=Rasamsonia byssochlamydoides TaxID=89139 RepID=UPI00374420AA
MMASPGRAHASPLISEIDDRRRRRRPQLSCVLCRRRKVKCNRELPCDQCYKLSKGRSCVYTDIIQSPGDSDHGIPSSSNPVDTGRSAPQSNTGLRRLREHNAPLGESSPLRTHRNEQEIRRRDVIPVSSHATSLTASPGINRTASTQEAVPFSPRDQPLRQVDSIVTAHGQSELDEAHIDSSNDQPNLNFIEDGWMTEFHGESHWSTILPMLANVRPLIHNLTVCREDGTRASFWKYLTQLREKRILQLNADIINLALVTHVDLREDMASRAVCDRLVASYHDSFGKLYGVVPWRDFMRDYDQLWLGMENSRCEFLVILILVLSIGNAFVKDGEYRLPHSTVLKWFSMAKVWKNTTADMNKYSLTSLQVDILLFLTRRLYCIGPPNDSVGSAILVRNAMAMSLHKDPSHLVGMPVEERSLRWRLWYTVLELDVQSSLESGMQPTCPESDSWMGERLEQQEEGSMSEQPALIRSLPVRLKIAQLLNGSRFDLTYDMACELNDELTAAAGWSLSEERTTNPYPTNSFVEEHTRLLIRRAFLALHWPFAIRHDRRFYFSRNVCTFTALKILRQLIPGEEGSQHTTGLQTLIRKECSIYQNDAFPAAVFLCFELLRGVVSKPAGMDHALEQVPSLKQEAMDLLSRFIGLAEERVVGSEYSETAFVIPSVMHAYVCWVDGGASSDTSQEGESLLLQDMANGIAQRCIELMQLRSSPTFKGG